jgi:hypothetical protein
VRFARRGRRGLEGACLTIRDPLGLASREMRSEPAAVLVLPRVEPLGIDAAGIATGLGREASRLSAHAAELELDSLRPYRDGAPASRIHWPTVARRGEMVERRLIADVDLRPLGGRRATDIEPDLRSWAPLHARLAVVEASDGAPVAGRIERAGAVFWVAAGAAAPPAGIARAAAALRYLVTPTEVTGQRPEFTVAGCGVHRLGRRGRRRVAA